MANIKLRPLVVHDSASSQSAFNDTCQADASASVRAHCALPSPARTGKLVPAPPDTSASANEDTGVSKLRSKLRRLLGAHSSAPAPSVQKPTTPSQTASLRCASTADLNDRPPTSSNGSRATTSVPVSPSVVGANGSRGRFMGATLVVPNSPVSTAPATPASGTTSPMPTTNRSVPVPPTAAPNGGAPSPRCPSANSGRASSLRRAVSFSPTATTFPPLGSPGMPGTPAAAATNGSVSLGGGSGGSGGGVRGPLSSNSSFVSATGRMSSMVVVPEDEALSQDAGQGDYVLPLSSGSIPGPPRPPAHLVEFVIRNGRHSAGDPDAATAAAVAAAAAAAAASINGSGSPALLPSPHYATAAADGGNVMYSIASPVMTNGGGAAFVNGGSGGGAAAQLSPSRMSPGVPGAHQRLSSSSSSSTITTGNGYQGDGGGGGGGGGGQNSLSGFASNAALSSWSSDVSAAALGPFNAAAAAAAALQEPSPPAAQQQHHHHHHYHHHTHQLPGQQHQHQQLRAAPLKVASRSSGPEPGRPLSSSSSCSVTPAAPGAAAAASPRAPQLQSLPTTPLPPAPASALPSHMLSMGGGGGGGAVGGVPAHSSVPAQLTRGLSAFNLMIANGSNSRGANSSNSWQAAGAAHAVAPPPGEVPAAGVPAAPAPGGGAVAPPSPKQAAIRRTHSTIDNNTRAQPEAPSGPPGVLMALGASLPAEMKRKEWRIEDFTMLKRLYKGNYSAVHKALCRISMRLVVIKTYDTTRMTDLARNHVKREATLHAPLEHENILNLYAVFSQGPYVMLVEEVAEGGDLYHVLKSIPGHRLQEDRAVAGVLVPLLRSLAHLHEQGICHRDIKLENILFSDRQHTRMLLADFGIAISMRHERAVTRAGTTEYMSPEQLRCPFKRHPQDNKERTELHYGLGVDVWATGVLAYELLHGYPPFLGSHREETEQLIMTAEVQVAPQLSSGARDFILLCLNKDPADRPTVMQLLQHSWIRQNLRALR